MKECIERVLSLPQLTPSEEVNAAFTELVDAVVAHGKEPLLRDEDIRRQVQQRCAVAEGELERHWSGRITEADNPWAELEAFPYHENYKELTRREIGLLGRTGLQLCGCSSEVAMIGSGPLPLTGWWLHRLTGARITHVDASDEAIELSRGLATALDWPGKFVTGLGQSVALDEGRYDVIYVAGLAGETLAEKQAIVDHVRPALTPDGRLIARGAYGARTLLYPGFDAHAFEGVRLMEEYHPTDGVINSVFVYKQAA
ncbi:methyltransferase domain-containing protein [Candidatus Saccharibacteria bacterium oral taxon 488]|nr:methyltransferase domain-containing protein [Candidatus Saccharibacteria bacterium oral taxon 488]